MQQKLLHVYFWHEFSKNPLQEINRDISRFLYIVPTHERLLTLSKDVPWRLTIYSENQIQTRNVAETPTHILLLPIVVCKSTSISFNHVSVIRSMRKFVHSLLGDRRTEMFFSYCTYWYF